VELATGPDGFVYALVHTDKTLLAIDPATNRTRVVARLPDGPESMIFADGALWVLLWHKDSSADSTVVRIDPKSGTQTRSERLGKNAWEMAVGGDHVWVLHDERISVIDAKTLAKQPDIAIASNHRTFAFVAGAVFTEVGTTIVRIDPTTKEVTHRADMHEPIAVMVAAGNDLVAAGRGGKVWRLDASNLAVKAELTPKASFVPMFIVPNGDTFLITEHATSADKTEMGRLIVVRPH
jgi:DNA-binding beta-propeller fold protein YncE